MSERKWRYITVSFDNGANITIRREDFEQLEEITPVLDALLDVKRMQHEVNRLLGEKG